MELTSESGSLTKDPTVKDIADSILLLNDSDNRFMILSRDRMSYLQVYGSSSSGWTLEYQEGSPENHFSCSEPHLSTARVQQTFIAYLEGNCQWKSIVSWDEGQGASGAEKVNSARFSSAFTLRGIPGPLMFILLLIMLVGVGFIGASHYLKSDTLAFQKLASPVEAEVVKLHDGRDSTVAPVYLFTTPDGNRYLYRSQLYSYPPLHRLGDRVTLHIYIQAPGFPDSDSIRYIPKSLSTSEFLNKMGVLIVLFGILLWHLVSIGGELSIENRGGLSALFGQQKKRGKIRLQGWLINFLMIGFAITGYLYIGGVMGALIGLMLYFYFFALMRIILN